MAESGTVIRGGDGEIYFLRDSVLEQAKVTEPEMKAHLENVISGKLNEDPQPNRFNVRLGNLSTAVPVNGEFAAPKFDATAMSTVMCPGTVSEASVRISPSKVRF
jgi:hypothetical protein